jgi:hypothetical protein
MNTKRIMECKIRIFSACLAATVAWALLTVGPASYAQTTPANLSPDLQEIVKFAQAHMTDDVILAYIKNSGKAYNLSGDDMIYLTSQGVSQAVLSALLQTKGAAPAPAPVPTPEPAPAPVPAPASAPQPGLVDVFASDASLNPAVWIMQTPLLQSLAQWNASAPMPPIAAFSPAGMQMSGVNGPGQFAGIQSAASFMAPFTTTVTVTGLVPEGIPFDVYLVSPDLRQWLSVAGHLGGEGRRRGGVGVVTPFGGVRVPFGREASPEYGIWANWTGSAQPISALGNKIYPEPIPGVPYTITMTVGADGMASVSLQDANIGAALGGLNAMPVGTGPFNVVLASRRMGPTFASWRSVQLTPLGPPPVAVAPAPPETPTLDYFQAHLTPYGQWIDVPGIGAAWVPAEANNLDWRPYMDAGQWEYTDAGWYWQSTYPWGDMAFHYGRWVNNEFTGARWAWVPGYDWAPSWVSWREGEGGMGWAPLPWDVEFRVGLGLYWHGGPIVAGVDFGLGFGAFVFVGADHFWGGNYNVYVFDRERSRTFYEHSTFHAGYRMEGGHLMAEGLGRDRVAAITHHEVVVHRAAELKRAEESHNFTKRTEEHKELAHAPARGREPARAENSRGPESRAPGATPGRPGSPTGTPGHGPTPALGGKPSATKPGSARPGASESGKKPD